MTRVAALVLLSTAMTSPVVAQAPGESPRLVVVDDFAGPLAEPARHLVVRTLARQTELSLVPVADLHAAIDDFAATRRSESDIRRLSAALGFHSILTGTLRREGRFLVLEVVVHEGASGSSRGRTEFRATNARQLQQLITARLWDELGSAILTADAAEETDRPVREEEAVDDDRAEPLEAEPEEPSPTRRQAILHLGLGFFTRDFTYTDDLFAQLRGYQLRFGPYVSLGAEFYPKNFFVGFFAKSRFAFALSSQSPAGTEFTTRSFAWEGGVRGRIPFHDHEFGVTVGAGGDWFRVLETADDDPNVPNAEYVFLSFGLDGQINVAGQVDVIGGCRYRLVLSGGEITSDAWFPRAHVGGIDGEIGLRYRFTSAWELRALFHARRYFFTINPEPGDPWIAGGALDQYRGGELSVHVRF